MTPESLEALATVRRAGAFEWHVVGQLAFVVYVYARAVRRGEGDRVALAIGWFALELVWEMFNALVLHFTDHAALWMVHGRSAFVIYVGLNVEIALMFAVAPVVVLDLLPDDPQRRIAGMPARWFVPVALGTFCVLVECALNRMGALVWTWWFWSWPHVWLILAVYILPFRVAVWVHEHVGREAKVRGAVVAVVLAVAAHLVFATGLGWV